MSQGHTRTRCLSTLGFRSDWLRGEEELPGSIASVKVGGHSGGSMEYVDSHGLVHVEGRKDIIVVRGQVVLCRGMSLSAHGLLPYVTVLKEGPSSLRWTGRLSVCV